MAFKRSSNWRDLAAAELMTKVLRKVELAGDVPEGHIDGGDGVYHEAAVAQVAVGAEHALPQVLDAGRVFADDDLGHRLGQGAGDGCIHVVDLAPAGDALAGLQLHVALAAGGDRREAGDADAGSTVLDCTRHFLTFSLLRLGWALV